MVVRQLRLVIVSVVLAACGSPAPPGEVVIDRVDPGRGQSRQVVPVRIEGSGFRFPLASNLDGRTVTTDLWVTVGAVPLEDVVWRGEQLIEGVVPAGLAPGPHDVTVTFGDRTGVLVGGYQVTGEAARLGFTTAPLSVPSCTCSGVITVEARDAIDQPALVTTATRVTLTADSSTLGFYADSGCTSRVIDATIVAGESSVSFYVKDTVLGTPTIVASTTGLIAASQTESVPVSPALWYRDADSDGFGAPAVTSNDCAQQPVGFVATGSDCDDDPVACGASCFPGNPSADVCDGRNQDCDLAVDENPDRVWYTDADADGFGKPGTASSLCVQPVGSSPNALDCADMPANDPGCGGMGGAVCSPSQTEGPAASMSCGDSADNDCDGFVDGADPTFCACAGACAGCTSGCCREACGAGDCTRTCNGPCACAVNCAQTTGTCTLNCNTTDCEFDCSGVATCDVGCNSTDSACNINCTGATACDQIRCSGNAQCVLDCTGAGTCGFATCGGTGGVTSCPGDIIVCNRPCP